MHNGKETWHRSRLAGGFGAKHNTRSSLAAFLPQLTKAVFEKKGFARATLVTDWEAVVGRDIASKCRPLKLNWPRLPAGATPADVLPGRGERRPGGRLTLSADPAFAMEIPYLASLIRERINGYYGYSAVNDVRVTVAPQFLDHNSRATATSGAVRGNDGTAGNSATSAGHFRASGEGELMEATPDVEHDRVRDALARLGSSIRKERFQRPLARRKASS